MASQVLCGHGAKASPTAPNPRVKVMGQPVPMPSPPYIVAGCPFQVATPGGPVPNPCVSATFLLPTMTARVKSMGQPLLCQSSTTGPATAAGPVPTGPPLTVVSAVQARVKAL
ncbi:MAG: hypothetical protein RMN25_03085 [Anaerolineae bacterium]|nr:hypothetical protein [Thermoflexales bacterium]MDW8406742.1 hypothetical protein [Anaerolineae bacterium]